MAEQTRSPALPPAASLTIALAFLAGVGTLGVAVRELFARGDVSRVSLATLMLLTSLVVASWVWPLVMFHDQESEAVHLDEGFLVIMAVVLPAPAVVVGFASAIVMAQMVRRR